GAGTENRRAVNASPPSGGPDIAGHRVEQCRLAAARRTEQTHERARRDIDRGIFQRVIDGRALPERYRHLPDLDSPERLACRRATAAPSAPRRLGARQHHDDAPPSWVGSAIPADGPRRRPDNCRTSAPPIPPRSRMRNGDSKPPIGCSANAVATLTPNTASPTTQVGAAQHTTQVMVIVAAPANSAPPAAAADAPSRAKSGHVLRTARKSTTLVASSNAITSVTPVLAGTSTKLHSAI